MLAENVELIAAIHAEYSAKAAPADESQAQGNTSSGTKAKARLADRTNRRAAPGSKTANVFEFDDDDTVTPSKLRKAKTSKRSRATRAADTTVLTQSSSMPEAAQPLDRQSPQRSQRPQRELTTRRPASKVQYDCHPCTVNPVFELILTRYRPVHQLARRHPP